MRRIHRAGSANWIAEEDRQLAADVDAGRLAPTDVPSAVDKAMSESAAKQPGRAASWGDKPNTTVMIGLTIRF